jgi:ankyrin repeat protein
MLVNIENESAASAREARRVLTLLCFAPRPLTVPELLHGIAVDLEEPPSLDRRRFLAGGADDLKEICPGLIDFGVPELSFDSNKEDPIMTVRIAHFSVQEYLESSRIKEQNASSFALSAPSAHAEIAQICCVYLLDPELSSGKLNLSKLQDFPLAHFAALFWHHHYEKSQEEAPRLYKLIGQFFLHQDSFFTSLKLHDMVDRPWESRVQLSLPSNEFEAPLYYASYLGFGWAVEKLLEPTSDGKSANKNSVNAQGGYYGNALQAASYKGHELVVKLLLDKGADINAQGGDYGNALKAAAAEGHEPVVKLLLEKGADVNAQGGRYGNALQAALYKGHELVVKLLLNKGANVNAQGGHYSNALWAAAAGGHEPVVKLLLGKGADVNAQVGDYSSALRAASAGGHELVVKLLLDKGANVNAQGGRYGNALQTASYQGHELVVKLLLNKGANVNAQGGHYSNALQAASARGHKPIVKLLLDKGANVNAQGGPFSNALEAASYEGYELVVKLLIKKGANIHAQGRH